MSTADLVGGIIFCVALLGIIGAAIYTHYDIKLSSAARRKAREECLRESHARLQAFLAADRARQRERAASAVAQIQAPPHNPVRRRMLPLN